MQIEHERLIQSTLESVSQSLIEPLRGAPAPCRPRTLTGHARSFSTHVVGAGYSRPGYYNYKSVTTTTTLTANQACAGGNFGKKAMGNLKGISRTSDDFNLRRDHPCHPRRSIKAPRCNRISRHGRDVGWWMHAGAATAGTHGDERYLTSSTHQGSTAQQHCHPVEKDYHARRRDHHPHCNIAPIAHMRHKPPEQTCLTGRV